MGGIGSGRPSRPKEVKDLVGEKPSRQNNAVPELEKAADFSPPSHLHDDAAKIWDYYAPGLAKAGVLAYADFDMLAEFCVAVATARQAMDRLEAEGYILYKAVSGDAYVNPWQRIHKDAVNDMQRIAARFGLTPGDRSRIVTPPANEDKDEHKDPGRYLT